jgi:hypothetical protein
MKTTVHLSLGLLAGAIFLGSGTSADAFWAARGAAGGWAVGGVVRPPVVAGHYYGGGCWHCAPLYAPGAVVAGAAIGAAAATAAAGSAAAPASSSSTTVTNTNVAVTTTTPPASSSGGSAKAAPACVSGLSADARVIYNASKVAGANASNVRDVVTAQTRSLVMAGKIPQSTAKADAQSAGQCLAQAS